MNLYDKKTIRCTVCDIFIGEIDIDAQVILPKCGMCANPTPEVVDTLPTKRSNFEGRIPVVLTH